MDATGQAHINASTKDLARLAKRNALVTATKHALQAASGRTAEQTPIAMPKTFNAATHYATNLRMSMTPQEQQRKTHAQIPLTMTVT